MFQEDEGIAAGENAVIQKPAPHLIPIIICASISLFFMNTGFLSLFYLVPLGYAVMAYGSFWLTFFAAAAFNAVFRIVTRLISGVGSGILWMEILYITVLFLGFIWIVGGAQMRAAYRFVLASAAGSVVFLFYVNRPDSAFYAFLERMAAAVLFSEGDAVRASVLQQMFTPEKLVELVKSVMFRGGALISTSFLFFINRQLSFSAVWIIKKQRKDKGLTAFFAPSYTIWVLSCSLAIVLLSTQLRLRAFEIIAWNVFAVCAIIFLAQGAGILLCILSRRSGGFRFFASILIIIAIFSPVLNTVAIAGLLLLGIMENWLPFRAPKEGQASTPGQ